jgi:HEAT repeat protein
VVATSSHAQINKINQLVQQLAISDDDFRARVQRKDPDAFNYTTPSERLAKIGKPAVGALIQALSSSNPIVVGHAAQALAEIGDPRAFDAIVSALRVPNLPYSQDRYHAEEYLLDALRRLQYTDIGPLLKLFDDKDFPFRASFAIVLGLTKDPRAIGPLIAAMNEPLDSSSTLPEYSAIALSSIGVMAVDPLIDELQSPKPRVRDAAVSGLAKIGSPAVTRLTERLSSATGEFMSAVAASLGSIDDQRANSALLDALPRSPERIAPVLIRKGTPGTENALISAFNASPSYPLALIYLNCGNPMLEDSARVWASRNGFQIVSGPAGRSVTWGRE